MRNIGAEFLTVLPAYLEPRAFAADNAWPLRMLGHWPGFSFLIPAARSASRSADGTSSSDSRAGGLADQVVALGDVRGPTGGLGVR